MTINAISRTVSLPWVNGNRVGTASSSGSSYSPTVIVTNQTELNAQLAKSGAALDGQVIGVQYNAMPYVITDTYKNKNFGTSGLVITSYGATKPIFSSIQVKGWVNSVFDNLEVYRQTSGTLFIINSGTQNLTVKSCIVHGDYYDPNGSYGAYAPSVTQAKAFTSISSGVGDPITDVYIQDCEIYDVLEVLTTSQRISGNFHFERNTCHTFYTGALAFDSSGGGGTTKVNWNTFYEPYGKETDADIGLGTPPHVDFIQPRAVQRDWTLEIIGNLMFPGNSRQQAPQCIFMDDQHVIGDETHFYTATIKGNVCITNSTHAISVLQAKTCTVIGNTVIHTDNTATIGAKISIGTGTASYPNGNGGGNVVKNSVAHTINGSSTETNNNEYNAYTTLALSDRFDGPTFTGLNARATVLSALNMKVAGLLDQAVNIGAIGSGYVDFTNRTINGAME